MPADARWSQLQTSARQPTIRKTVDDAMVAIQRDNPSLKGVLTNDYARPALDKHRLIDRLATTRRLAIMNIAIRGIEADIGKEHADTFRHVLHPDLRADYVLASPPFNDSDWFRKDNDVWCVAPLQRVAAQMLSTCSRNQRCA